MLSSPRSPEDRNARRRQQMVEIYGRFKTTEISVRRVRRFRVHTGTNLWLSTRPQDVVNHRIGQTRTLWIYLVVGLTEDLTEDHVTYRGPNAAEVFIKHMVQLEERLINKIRNPKSMEMTDEDFEPLKTPPIAISVEN